MTVTVSVEFSVQYLGGVNNLVEQVYVCDILVEQVYVCDILVEQVYVL